MLELYNDTQLLSQIYETLETIQETEEASSLDSGLMSPMRNIGNRHNSAGEQTQLNEIRSQQSLPSDDNNSSASTTSTNSHLDMTRTAHHTCRGEYWDNCFASIFDLEPQTGEHQMPFDSCKAQEDWS